VLFHSLEAGDSQKEVDSYCLTPVAGSHFPEVVDTLLVGAAVHVKAAGHVRLVLPRSQVLEGGSHCLRSSSDNSHSMGHVQTLVVGGYSLEEEHAAEVDAVEELRKDLPAEGHGSRSHDLAAAARMGSVNHKMEVDSCALEAAVNRNPVVGSHVVAGLAAAVALPRTSHSPVAAGTTWPLGAAADLP